jgi:UDP-N-acetylmuramate--alanine ligase
MRALRWDPRDEAQGQARAHSSAIGGAGMSGIAEVLVTQGYHGFRIGRRVERRHRAPCASRRRRIRTGHLASHIAGADAVVVSTAIARRQSRDRRGARARAYPSCRAH